MKKIIFSLFAIAMLASCGEKTAYTIVGDGSGAADGIQVFIYEDRRGKTVLETTTIQNGKFEFAGEQKEPIVRFIGIEGVNKAPQPVVVEAGDIRYSSDGITGTPLNNKAAELGKALAESEDPDSNLIFEFIKNNTDNVLGLYLYERNSYAFEIDQLKEIMALIPEKVKQSSEGVRVVQKYIGQQEATAVGAKFLDLKGLSPDGKEVSLSDYAGTGKIVLVDFWASWCPPCRADMPKLVEAYAKYKDKGFEIVGVSLDKKNEDWVKGIEELNITWPQLSDLKYWDSELSAAYGVRSIPFTVLIDGDGVILEKKIKGADLDARLSELFK